MKKETITRFGNTYYLLGIRKEDDKKVYLKKPTFDCGWYWGIGYVETFRRNDIHDHQHFDSLFLSHNIYDGFKDYFKEITLDDKEIWTLLELMQSAYTMRKYSDMLHSKGAHISSNPLGNLIASDHEYNRINNIIMPSINNEIEKLLS